MKKCLTCGAENPEFLDFQTNLCIKTKEGTVLFSVDTKTDECLNCVRESIHMMHGEMVATLPNDGPKDIKLFINTEELWEDINERPIELLTKEQREERISKSK